MIAWFRFTWFLAALAAVGAFTAPSAHAQDYSDIWWNPNESGWGLTIADHGSQLFAVWFTYRQDGKPTWYVIPGGTLSSDHKHFQGDVYTTTGPAYSTAIFDPSRVTVTKVGTASIDFASFGAATFAYNVAGVAQTKQIQRQPFGNGTPRWGLDMDVTDIWWNPAESGWGLTLAQHGNNVFGVWFTYDTDGQPLWVVMPGVSFTGDQSFTGTLYTTTGPYFGTQPFDPSKVVVTQAGNATFSWSEATVRDGCGGVNAGTFQTTLRGASRQAPTCQQPFGNPAQPPSFPGSPAPNGAALFSAPANPLDATITTDDARKVTKFIAAATGGSISATDGNGNAYTLDIPPNALMDDTPISITPITSVSGPKYASGVAYGVKLEPDGTVLDDNVVLTLTPAADFPLALQTGFTSKGDGTDLHQAPPGPDYARIQVQISHFSFLGWLAMSAAERAAEDRMAYARDNEARIMNQVGKFLQGVRQDKIAGIVDSATVVPTPAQLANWVEDYYANVVVPRILAASGSCYNATTALTTLKNFTRMRVTAGGYDDGVPYLDSDLARIRFAFKQVSVKTPCVLEEMADMETVGADGIVKATVNARWVPQAQTGNVIKYIPVWGWVQVDYPSKPPCTVENTRHDLSLSDGILTVDWDARSYSGAAIHKTTLQITCPNDSQQTVYPALYLGDMNNQPTGFATGPVNGTTGTVIGPASHSFATEVDNYHFDAVCNGGFAIYCGQ